MSSDQRKDFIPSFVLLSGVLTATSIGAFVILTVMICTQLALERARLQHEGAASLPTCDWRIAPGNEYVCFLSQCVIERRTEMLRCACANPLRARVAMGCSQLQSGGWCRSTLSEGLAGQDAWSQSLPRRVERTHALAATPQALSSLLLEPLAALYSGTHLIQLQPIHSCAPTSFVLMAPPLSHRSDGAAALTPLV
jgi:hypothetical protein